MLIKNIAVICNSIEKAKLFESGLQQLDYNTIAYRNFESVPKAVAVDIFLCYEIFLDELFEFKSSRVEYKHLPVLLLDSASYDKQFISEAGLTTLAERISVLDNQLTLPAIHQKLQELQDEAQAQAAAYDEFLMNALMNSLDDKFLNGQFAQVTFSQLLFEIFQAQETGILHIERDNIKKKLLFQDGFAVDIRSNQAIDCLGQMLVSESLISLETCAAAFRASKANNTYQGEELILMEKINRNQLHRALERQALRKILEIFSWESGTFKFERVSKLKSALSKTTRLSPINTIIYGIQHMYSDAQLSSALSINYAHNLQALKVYNFLQFQPFFSDQYWQVLKKLQALPLDIDLLDETPESEYYAEKQLFAALVLAKIIGSTKATTFSVAGNDTETELHTAEILRDFITRYQNLKKQNFFEILDLAQECSSEEVKQSFRTLAKSFHPDKTIPNAAFLPHQDAVTYYFKRLSEAYTTLQTDTTRLAYKQRLIDGSSSIDLQEAIDSEMLYRSGISALRSLHYTRAEQLLKKSLKYNSKNAECRAHYAWALYMSDLSNVASQRIAIALLKNVIVDSPDSKFAYFYTGKILQSTKKPESATKYFKKAVRIDSKYHEALRELRLIELRATKKIGSFFNRF